MKPLNLLSAVLISLLSTQSLSAQLFYKLKISVDSYSIGNVNTQKITRIFVENGQQANDLSLVAYRKKLSIKLLDMGFTLATSRQNSDFVLSYSLVSEPVLVHGSSINYQPGTTSTVTRTNSEGKEEEFKVAQPGTHQTYQTTERQYRKALLLNLIQTANSRLIWQAESVIQDEQEKHARYTNYLVYTAMQHFLRETNQHPLTSLYGRRHLRLMNESFDTYRYRR